MPFEGISVSDSRVKADSNCLLQILALSRVSVFKIPFSLSELIPNASFLRDLTNDHRYVQFFLKALGYMYSLKSHTDSD